MCRANEIKTARVAVTLDKNYGISSLVEVTDGILPVQAIQLRFDCTGAPFLTLEVPLTFCDVEINDDDRGPGQL